MQIYYRVEGEKSMTEVPASGIKVHEKEKSYKGEFKYIMPRSC